MEFSFTAWMALAALSVAWVLLRRREEGER
jgi:uncharacterized protein (TIGR03382 family)